LPRRVGHVGSRRRSPHTVPSGRYAAASTPAALPRRVVLDDQLNLTGDRDLGALRARDELRLQLVERDLEVTRNRGKHLGVTTGGRHLEGLETLALGLDLDRLPRLHAERWAVDELAVDED